MPEIVESVRVEAKSADVWRKVGKFGALADWHPMLANMASEGEREGSRRIAETRNGSRQTERLLELEPARHFYRYRMEATAMPVRNYVGEFRVDDNGDRSSTVVWSARFDVTTADENNTVRTIRDFFKTGLAYIETLSSRLPVVMPPPRPLVWPLRAPETADTTVERLANGCRRIVIRHAELNGVSPAMLAWWYAHVVGDMEYAGAHWPRYLVWHPLDHISYEITQPSSDGGGPGTRLHIREAFQRDPENLLDVTATVERIDAREAIISNHVLGLSALRLVNRFDATAAGARYVTEMTIGDAGVIGRLFFNRFINSRVLSGSQERAWIRHHIEEVGNLENFLPQLYQAKGLSIEPPQRAYA
jgi:polyketide cyclase/dehydrase/lipid transport protein